MNYAKSKQQREAFAKNVFKNFTDVCGGDPFEMFDILQGKYTVDDFAYHDDWYYFGITEYMNKTIIPHKIAVYNAGMRLLDNPLIDSELSQQCKEDFKYNLWIHDLSKFSAKEVFGYAMYNRGTGHGKEQFERAWHHHKMHNPHHPEYWLNPNRSGELEPLPMSNEYVLEMIADWIGAGETYGTPLDQWAKVNLPKFKFANRAKVGELIRDFTGLNAKMEDRVLVIE
jgi:hypothetical protein